MATIDYKIPLLFLLLPSLLFSSEQRETPLSCPMLDEAELINSWTVEEVESLPITYNHLYSSGYFTTPSARMGEAGEIGVGYANLFPYYHWNVRVQPFSFLECTINWRIFRGREDPYLLQHEPNEFADRGANAKLALITPEATCNVWPGIAIGIEDFIGSKRFANYFIVGSKVWLPEGIPLETSFGWGTGRYSHGPSQGFFGGASWFPFWNGSRELLKTLSLSAEFDPIDYHNPKKEPHPDGRISHSPVNFGVKYKFQDLLDLSAGYVQGNRWATEVSLQYNWGTTKGLFPKIYDPLFYCSPIDKEPLGCLRTGSLFSQNIAFALQEQGFLLVRALLLDEKTVVLSLVNQSYREEAVVKMRLQSLLSALIPSNIDTIIVVVESYSLPCQQYVFTQELLVEGSQHSMSPCEFLPLISRQEARDYTGCGHLLFERKLELWDGGIAPRFESFFGNDHGRFKYDLGIRAAIEGYLPYQLIYDMEVSYNMITTLKDISIVDASNPSSLPVVLTDYVLYRRVRNFSLDRAYLTRFWNMGKGYFSRLALGYYQVDYAGATGEILWYPARSCLAIGAEGSLLKKRRYTGLGFQSKLLEFEDSVPTFHSYSVLPQYFLNFYLDFPRFGFFTKISAGQFLAGDHGVRLEATRYFESGLRLTGWMTITDAHDQVQGREYFNRGIAIEFPLDFFYLCSSRNVWNYGTAAWLRDAGAFTWTGKELFEIINRERR